MLQGWVQFKYLNLFFVSEVVLPIGESIQLNLYAADPATGERVLYEIKVPGWKEQISMIVFCSRTK